MSGPLTVPSDFGYDVNKLFKLRVSSASLLSSRSTTISSTITMPSQQDARKSALRAFMAIQQDMDNICDYLRLNSGSQVHKELIRAIIQVTGYGKKYPKNCGLIEPRNQFSDGTHSSVFTEPFQFIVDDFLDNLRAGVIFFPDNLPDYAGWDVSFWGELGGDRLRWNSKPEKEEIRVCMLLMFENIKNNGSPVDLTGVEVRVHLIVLKPTWTIADLILGV
jgi:hypothetical protein